MHWSVTRSDLSQTSRILVPIKFSPALTSWDLPRPKASVCTMFWVPKTSPWTLPNSMHWSATHYLLQTSRILVPSELSPILTLDLPHSMHWSATFWSVTDFQDSVVNRVKLHFYLLRPPPREHWSASRSDHSQDFQNSGINRVTPRFCLLGPSLTQRIGVPVRSRSEFSSMDPARANSLIF